MTEKAHLSIALASILALCPAASHAAVSLSQVYSDAVENDPEIRSEQAILRAETDRMDISGGRLYPSVILSGELARNREDVEVGTGATGTSGITYFDSNRIELTVKQALYRKDVFAQVDKDNASAMVAQYEYQSAFQAFILRVVSRYFEVLGAHNDHAYLEAERDAIKRQLKDAQRRHQAGSGTRVDLYEAQASYDLAQSQLIVAESAYQDAQAALEEITDNEYQQFEDIPADFIPAFDGPFDLSIWLDRADNGNLELQASHKRIDALRHEVEQASSGHYPELDMVARYRLEETGGRFGESETDDASISLQLTLPIYEGGQVRAEVREAGNRLLAEKEQHTKIFRNIHRSVKNSYRSVNSSINQANALKQAMVSAEIALDAIRSGFKAGTRTTSDVLDAQRELFRAKRDYMQMQYTFILSLLELKRLVGSLAKEDIILIDGWLQSSP